MYISGYVHKEKIMTEYDKIINYNALYRAYKKSMTGRSYRKASGRFSAKAAEGINILRHKLGTGKYEVGSYNEFIVYRPKQRLIKACQFQDKIVQHTVCDEVLNPVLKDIFIYDSYGSQKGKGTSLARQRLREHMHEMHKLYKNVYILKCDIKKYFYSIQHEQLLDAVKYYFDDKRIVWLCEKFINSTQNPGIALGNQINQIMANLNLDGLDKFILYDLSAAHYGRYMDDFYIISHDREYLKWCKYCISEYLKTLNLQLNGKTEITTISHGVQWLGFNYKMTSAGEIVARKTNAKKRDVIKRYRKMAKLLAENKIEFENFMESFNAWACHLWEEGCIGLIRQTEKIIIETINQYRKKARR